MSWKKIEKFSKVIEKWHNRLYRFVCIGMFIIITNITGVGIIGWSNYRTLIKLSSIPYLSNILLKK